MCASEFHKGGARLILCGKSWEKLEELADDLLTTSDPSVVSSPTDPFTPDRWRQCRLHASPPFPPSPQTFPPKLVLLDFGDMESMPEAIAEVLECYGCLDILIINSSMKVKAPAQNVTLQMDKLLMDNNYFGPVTLAKGDWRHFIPAERLWGRWLLRSYLRFRRSSLHDLQEDGPPAPGQQHSRKTGCALSHVLWVNWFYLFVQSPSCYSNHGNTGPLTLQTQSSTLSSSINHTRLCFCFVFSDAASKHAVQAFFDSLRAEVEEYGISVSTINHTFISNCASQRTEASAAEPKSLWSREYDCSDEATTQNDLSSCHVNSFSQWFSVKSPSAFLQTRLPLRWWRL